MWQASGMIFREFYVEYNMDKQISKIGRFDTFAFPALVFVTSVLLDLLIH